MILNYNGKDHLVTYLPSVIRNNHKEAEIIVADNGSHDDSLRYMQSNYPDIRILEIPENKGFAGGYNTALKHLEHEYFVLLNSDVEVTPNWLDPIIDQMDRNILIAAVQPKVLSWRNKSMFEHAGACGGFLDSLTYSFCRGRIMDEIEDDIGQYDNPIRICWATGAAMVIRGKLYHAMEGFDERYFAHFEEIDLCWRLRRAGYLIGVEPTSVVYHLGGGTLAYNTPFKIRLNFRNSLFTIWKNEPIIPLLYKFPLRLVLDGVAAVQFLIQGNLLFFKAVFSAHIEFYKALPSSMRIRKRTRNIIKTAASGVKEDRSTIYKGLIIFDFFIRRKKKFHEIMRGNEI